MRAAADNLQFPRLCPSRGSHVLRTKRSALFRRAAASLAPNLRGKFLQSIAHELADVDPIDDEAVQRAVDARLSNWKERRA
jgi:hypothetical protein